MGFFCWNMIDWVGRCSRGNWEHLTGSDERKPLAQARRCLAEARARLVLPGPTLGRPSRRKHDLEQLTFGLARGSESHEPRRSIRIFDTTLRDGEQSPGASMNLNEKLEIAQALVDLGVDIIEAGFPIASPGDFEAVRADRPDDSRAGDLRPGPLPTRPTSTAPGKRCKHAESPRIHVFLATSAIHREFKLKMDKEEIIAGPWPACSARGRLLRQHRVLARGRRPHRNRFSLPGGRSRHRRRRHHGQHSRHGRLCHAGPHGPA